MNRDLSLPFFKTELIFPPEITIYSPGFIPSPSFVNQKEPIISKIQNELD